jgi:hypothetical protein
LCKENHTTSPRHGDSHTEPIAFSEIVKHTPIVAFVSLGSTERGRGRLEEGQAGECDSSEPGYQPWSRGGRRNLEWTHGRLM